MHKLPSVIQWTCSECSNMQCPVRNRLQGPPWTSQQAAWVVYMRASSPLLALVPLK
jgi:hypothetical protein